MLRLVAGFLLLCTAFPGWADTKLVNQPGLPLRREAVEVRLTDGSKLFLNVGEETLTLTTPYGKLQVKLADVKKIEFGLRIPADVEAKIDAAVAALTSTDKQASGWAGLIAAGEWASPALKLLAQHEDRTIASRAKELLGKLIKDFSEERLKRIGRDVVHTEHSRIGGRVELTEIRATTPYFGPVKIKVADLTFLRRGGVEKPDEIPVNVQPDPGALTNFQQRVGQTFYFRVTGGKVGSVWGSDIYTTDSSLATAAVHAGVLKMGETGIIKVTILPGQAAYSGSTRNGISTSAYGSYPGSYKVHRVGQQRED